MQTRSIGAALVLAALAWGGAAQPARAGDTAEERLQRLEEALKLQAEEIARLKAELAARREAAPTQTAPRATAPAAPPPSTGPAPLPAPPPSPAAGDVIDGVGGPAPQAARATVGERYVSSGGVRWGGYATIEWIAPSNQNSHFD